MILSRTQDAEHINAVINDPDVRPFVGAPEAGPLDLAPVVERPEHWFLMGEHGGFALLWSAPRAYEVHTFVLPAGRGKWAAAARAAMIDFAKRHKAQTLWTKIPPDARHVEHFARGGGMQPTEEVIETFGEPYRVFKMELA
jgi:hypothetical protein